MKRLYPDSEAAPLKLNHNVAPASQPQIDHLATLHPIQCAACRSFLHSTEGWVTDPELGWICPDCRLSPAVDLDYLRQRYRASVSRRLPPTVLCQTCQKEGYQEACPVCDLLSRRTVKVNRRRKSPTPPGGLIHHYRPHGRRKKPQKHRNAPPGPLPLSRPLSATSHCNTT